MTDYAIEIQDISKRYYIGSLRQGNKSIGSFIKGMIRLPFDRIRALMGGKAPSYIDKEIWALKNIDIKIPEGQSVGIIGNNGSGKSTLLKMIAGVAVPTTGQIVTRGHILSMLSVGTGFHMELTGRENVYINAAILGKPPAEVEEIYDDIVEFAEIAEFMDTPLKRNSSGMRLRLAFAVAIHIQPDIIILDEVLAVGDRGFREKCVRAIEERHRDTTVVIVSHNIEYLRRICDRIIWMDKGVVLADGEPAKVVNDFIQFSLANTANTDTTSDLVRGNQYLTINHAASRHPQKDVDQANIASTTPVEIEIDYTLHQPIENLRIVCDFIHINSQALVFSTSDADTEPRHELTRPAGRYRVRFMTPPSMFIVGEYAVNVRFYHPGGETLYAQPAIIKFNIANVRERQWVWFPDETRQGFINFDLDWIYHQWGEEKAHTMLNAEKEELT